MKGEGKLNALAGTNPPCPYRLNEKSAQLPLPWHAQLPDHGSHAAAGLMLYEGMNTSLRLSHCLTNSPCSLITARHWAAARTFASAGN